MTQSAAAVCDDGSDQRQQDVVSRRCGRRDQDIAFLKLSEIGSLAHDSSPPFVLSRTRGKPGDLFAETKIMVPSKLTKEERHLFEELAGASKFDPRKQES